MNDAPAANNLRRRWLNRTVLGTGLASLFSDWSHEIATAVLPTFLATMGVAALEQMLAQTQSNAPRLRQIIADLENGAPAATLSP